ncbi:MAG: TonB-dependent siderophore receptor [Martelella sp.]|uniref:TonB-dependent siderophore receptor n=1 Tax=unclassified Martelella TaxID=2629616 RepID=UPI000C52D054|nr:TonB-dependent siderophore receptor [Martelella sp.]MAU21885.1 TonB-dependent siderophore receptor [Martelella sp.]
MTTAPRLALLSATTSFLALTGPVLAQEATTILEPVTVETQAGLQAESGNAVFVRDTSAAMKTETPVIETPQSVTTVTRKQMDEQSPQTVSQALRYTAGVLSDRDANTRYNSIFMRGFGAFGTATSYVSYLDGLKLPRGQAFAQVAIDPYLLDRIDVLKGPSGVLYGQMSPGGLVDQVSRVPSAEPYNEVFLQGGSFGRVQGGITSRGSLSEDDSLLYSFTGIGRSSGTRYDDVDEEIYGFAPSLTWQPDEDTSLTISGYYQNTPEGGYFNSIYPTFLAPEEYQPYLGRDVNIGDPNYDYFNREQYGIGYDFEHYFSDSVKFESALRYSDVDIDFRSLQMAAPLDANGDIPRQALRSIEHVGGVSTDNRLTFEFDTGAVEHTMLFGFDYQHSDSDWQYQYGAAPALNVVNPVYGQPIAPLMTIIDSKQTLQQTGIYLQDQMSFGGLHAVLGIRQDWTEQESTNRLAGTTSSQSDEATTYKAGLLYAFDNGISPYVSYSTSFEPVIGVDAAGQPFVPSEAEQYEIGIKYEPVGWDALFTVSAFDITQQNALVPDALGFSRQAGEIRSRGLEFEARGNLTEEFELIAALTLLDTEYEKTFIAANEGNGPQAVPDYYGSVWGNYTFMSGALEGFSAGAGLRFVGASYADDANTVKVDGYTLVDAALRYDFGARSEKLKGLEATFNITNLFDEDYYASCSTGFYCQYGDGRQFLAGLNYKW